VQYVPVMFDHELLVQTMNNPDCVGSAVHGGYNGAGDVRKGEFKVNVEVEAELEPEVTEAEIAAVVGVERELVVELNVVEGDEVVICGGSTAAHVEAIVSRAVLTRSAAHDISKHELAKGLNV
jgi:hypothetical protein